ncbi:MAG: PHP domain-containing protein [Ruminococcaceae bacterium]|nr:PHP domain-containing protein [Oscillospiraceae bacterium]
MSNHLPAAVQSYLAEYRYKIELHAHTSPVSGCSHIPPAEIIRRLADKGYHAVAITNHFSYDNQFMKAEDPVAVYLADYYAAKEAGEAIGMKVYLGAEYRFTENSNDYLVYGVDETFLRETLHCHDMGFAAFYERYHGDDRLILQAHPFRPGLVRAPSDHMDGIEAFNMHPNHNSHVAEAARWAKEQAIPILTIGTDLHDPGHEGLCATRTKTLPETTAELIALLRSQDYLMEIAGCPLLPYAAF